MYSNIINKLINQFEKLPGIGHKTAVRLAFYILEAPIETAEEMAKILVEAKQKVKLCSKCFNITEKDPCEICSNPKRDETIICVLESVKDVIAMEKTHEFNGKYHVLHGSISPMNNITAGDIKVKELLERLKEIDVKEVILATNPTIEGETTAMYISRLIKPLGISVTRIAHGIPVGGDIEYTDEITLIKALEGRREM
ncbi:MAG: recombination mediator RecR [Clostridia bacterium]|nr:recombination mediator RecR [Clostridia bacterium]MDD4386187.1 recombination mediator RecR [Clostridia bacterium]